MGIILCDRHGSSGIVLVCEHIADTVEKEQQLTDSHEVWVRMAEWMVPQLHALCMECMLRHGVNPKLQVLDLEEIDTRLEESLNSLVATCAACFKASGGSTELSHRVSVEEK